MLIEEWINKEVQSEGLQGKRIAILLTLRDDERKAQLLRKAADELHIYCDVFMYDSNAPIDEYIKYYLTSTKHYDALYAPSLKVIENRYVGDPWIDGLIDYLIDINYELSDVVISGPAQFRSDGGHAFGYYNCLTILDPSEEAEGDVKLWGDTMEAVIDCERIDYQWSQLAVIRLLEVSSIGK